MLCLFAALLLVAQVPGEGSEYVEAGHGYYVNVVYPQVALDNHAIMERLEEYSTGQIEEFRDNFQEYCKDDPFPTEWTIEITITHEPSPEGLVCLVAWTYQYSGGAHGNTWTQGFVFDRDAGTFVDPVELMGGQGEFQAFAEEVMDQLTGFLGDGGWIEEGASASVENYHTLLPVPGEDGGIAGYHVIFPPYQVASYVMGVVDVYVPPELGPEDL